MDREELLRSARNLYENPSTNEALKVVLEYTYPELKESEDERIRRALIKQFSAISMETWAGIPKIDIIAYLEKQKEQKPAEWSEEDAAMLESIIKDYDYLCRIWLQDYEKRLGGADCEARIDIRNQITWLKSIRPQQKQWWSEKDKNIINGAVGALEAHGHEKLAKRLKSLRSCPKSSDNWKPSEEQMSALKHFIGPSVNGAIVAELYDDLKNYFSL